MPGRFHFEDRGGDVADGDGVLRQLFPGAFQFFLRRIHQVLVPHFAQLAPAQLVAGDEGQRLVQVAGQLVGDDSEIEAVGRICLRRGQAGRRTRGHHCREYVSSAEVHFRSSRAPRPRRPTFRYMQHMLNLATLCSDPNGAGYHELNSGSTIQKKPPSRFIAK
jgi:hypothetical protein